MPLPHDGQPCRLQCPPLPVPGAPHLPFGDTKPHRPTEADDGGAPGNAGSGSLLPSTGVGGSVFRPGNVARPAVPRAKYHEIRQVARGGPQGVFAMKKTMPRMIKIR